MNILSVLKHYHVHHVTEGNNVAYGNVNIQCPFCGTSDPSEHMGIDLKTGYWGCWRNDRHRGRDISTLMSHVLHLPKAQAQELLGSSSNPIEEGESFLGQMRSLVGEARDEKMDPRKVNLNEEATFKEIKATGVTRRFYDYLLERGFTNPLELVRYYEIKGCLIGKWKMRLIFPIFGDDFHLVGWVARAIAPTSRRYLFHPPGRKTKQGIFNYKNLFEYRKILIIAEGPIDAMKLEAYAPGGIHATCIFGTNPSSKQIAKLIYVGKMYYRTYVCFDHGAQDKALSLIGRLQAINPRLLPLPSNVEDPGELTPEEVRSLTNHLEQGL